MKWEDRMSTHIGSSVTRHRHRGIEIQAATAARFAGVHSSVQKLARVYREEDLMVSALEYFQIRSISAPPVQSAEHHSPRTFASVLRHTCSNITLMVSRDFKNIAGRNDFVKMSALGSAVGRVSRFHLFLWIFDQLVDEANAHTLRSYQVPDALQS